MLDEAPRERDGPIITPTVAKSIVGQAALQLGVMAALLGPLGDALTTHASDTAAVTTTAMVADGAGAALAAVTAATVAAVGEGGAERIEQYTLVFNSFVLMQLFNQVSVRVGRVGGLLLGGGRKLAVSAVRLKARLPTQIPSQ